jgi:vacuolar-type H+-ATPase subunit F/Vma7
MTMDEQMQVIAIGDEDMISGLRLAGLDRYHIINDTDAGREEVREIFSRVLKETGVGIVMLQENYAEYIEDLLSRIRKGKKMFPVVIEVPSKQGGKYQDVRGYYKAFIKGAIGFDVEI